MMLEGVCKYCIVDSRVQTTDLVGLLVGVEVLHVEEDAFEGWKVLIC
jgi:hypothetical protein